MEQVASGTKPTKNVDAVDMEIAELLRDLEADNQAEEVTAVSHEEVESAVEALEMEEAKQEIYAEQESTEVNLSEKPVVSEEPKPAKSAKPKRVSTAGMKAGEAICAIIGDKAKVGEMMAFDTNDANLSAADYSDKVNERLNVMDGLAKKQGMKAQNLVRWLKSGSKLEAYTHLAIDLLVKKGSFESGDLRDYYMSQSANGIKGYSQGTANSQTNQIMHLLPAFEIAVRNGKSLTLNENSTIVMHWKSVNGVS